MRKLKVLALNPFHGGSHKAFLNSWVKHSSHDFTLLTLPGTQWRWRLHFAAVDFSRQVRDLFEKGQRWDAIFCTSMMNVAEFRGLTPFLSDIPLTVYFHENQLSYPESSNVKFSLDSCMANIISAYTADAVWFNSQFHLEDFLKASNKLLSSKPGYPVEILKEIEKKSSVQYQGIDDEFLKPAKEFSNPVKLVWAARWEEDKNPGLLFLALKRLKEKGINFSLSVLGEEMGTRMECFEKAAKDFAGEICHFGFLSSREEYMKVLKGADIFISTAEHEFFGIAAVEAVAAGCIPVVPDHLAYPEVLSDYSEFFYKAGSSVSLAAKIAQLLLEKPEFKQKQTVQYFWSRRAELLDGALK